MEIKGDNIDEIKQQLNGLSKGDILISDHARDSLYLREGSTEELIRMILSCKQLVHSY